MEREIIDDIGSGLAGKAGGEQIVVTLEERAKGGDVLAPQLLRFYALRAATDAYNEHWHQQVVQVVSRAKTALVHLIQGQPQRDAKGEPTHGAVQKNLFDFERVEDLLALRQRMERWRNGVADQMRLLDAVIVIRERHPDLSGREAAASEGINPDGYTIDIQRFEQRA